MTTITWHEIREKHRVILGEWKTLKEKNAHLDKLVIMAEPNTKPRSIKYEDLVSWGKYKDEERKLLNQIPELYREFMAQQIPRK